jgi:hypothetical protein
MMPMESMVFPDPPRRAEIMILGTPIIYPSHWSLQSPFANIAVLTGKNSEHTNAHVSINL